jgi:hypothetical protein
MKKPEFHPFFYEKVPKNMEKVTNLPLFFDPLAQIFTNIARIFNNLSKFPLAQFC